MKKIIYAFVFIGVFFLTQAASAEWGLGERKDWEGRKKEKVENFIQKLNLTPEQQEQFRIHRQESKERSRQLRSFLKEKTRTLNAMFQDFDFDETQVRQAASEIQQIQSQLMEAHIDAAIYMRSVLTPEQYEEFFGAMKQFRERKEEAQGSRKRKIFKRDKDHFGKERLKNLE